MCLTHLILGGVAIILAPPSLLILGSGPKRFLTLEQPARPGGRRCGVMVYVYILKSLRCPGKTYVGLTNHLKRRLRQHNRGEGEFSSQFRPWRVDTYVAFSDEGRAKEFEQYLKSGGGWRFAKRRLM